MYTLRKITEGKLETNINIGNSYVVVTEQSKEEYDRTNQLFENQYVDLAYAFISFADGKQVVPLFKNQGNFILTENGILFENLTYAGK